MKDPLKRSDAVVRSIVDRSTEELVSAEEGAVVKGEGSWRGLWEDSWRSLGEGVEREGAEGEGVGDDLIAVRRLGEGSGEGFGPRNCSWDFFCFRGLERRGWGLLNVSALPECLTNGVVIISRREFF